MTALATALEKRLAAAKEERDAATGKGAWNDAEFNGYLANELQDLLDRTGSTVGVIELNQLDAERIADFLENHEEKFVNFLLARRVSLAARHSLNLINQLREYKG